MKKTFYLVVGFGKTGHSIAAYLQRRNMPFAVYDTRTQVEGLAAFQQDFSDTPFFSGALPEPIEKQIDVIIASPGVSQDDPVIVRAKARHIPVIGDIECLAQAITAPVVAITGTNGKSTVVSLVGEMFKTAGFKTAVAGNIGMPVLSQLDDGHAYDCWVLELSSFQLDLTDTLKPIASTILNISPDHLDRHHTMASYIEAKQRIYHQADTLIYNRDDRLTFPAHPGHGQFVSFGLSEPQNGEWGIIQTEHEVFLAYGDEPFLPIEALTLKGRHNWLNALAAAALAYHSGVDMVSIQHVLSTFQGLPHRCQWVRTLKGVHFINDSKGTNVGAAQSAIDGVGAGGTVKIVLIAGGVGKGADFSLLKQSVRAHVRALVLIGQDAPLIEAALKDDAPIIRADSMADAVLKAQAHAAQGDVVLLSPACASFDMFHDYNHRGDVFTQLVQDL